MTATQAKRKILIVEDDQEQREMLEDILTERFHVFLASNAEQGMEIARSENPDVVLLDIRMPGTSGLTLCQQLRDDPATRQASVIMLTGVDDTESRIQAFSYGADDFISRPIRTKELIARIQSKLRRLEERETPQQLIVCGNLSLSCAKYEVRIGDKPIPVSVLEFNLLKFLVENRDRVVSRPEILEKVWSGAKVSARTVDTHMACLRKKLEGFSYPLSTIYGAGYVIKTT